MASEARPRATGLAAVAGALAWTTFWAASGLGTGPAVASGIAAVAIGFCGELLTERLRMPPMLVAVCGIVPLLPGLTIYRGLFAIVVDADIQGGLNALVGAGAIGLALAAGVTLGEYLGRPVRGGRDRYDRRVRRRATTAEWVPPRTPARAGSGSGETLQLRGCDSRRSPVVSAPGSHLNASHPEREA
nr:threonine/serine exporter family protein [Geodermatophilus sabuli]